MKKSNTIDQRKDIRQKFFIVDVQAHLLFVASVVDQPESNRGETGKAAPWGSHIGPMTLEGVHIRDIMRGCIPETA